jgi:WD40 repeat protein/serine/threonine protein kinase
MAEEDPQRQLGEFLLRERLGEGGVGVVYRAVQTTLGREAVVKLLRAPHRARKDLGERFAREAQLASRLEHPYAAHVYAFGAEPDGLLWIAMERVRGTALSDFLRIHGPWSVDRLVPFFEKVCEAVQTAHDQGIIHRDLKPSNVMVLARAGQLLPKLLDFGVAKWLAPEELPAIPRAAAPAAATVPDEAADRERDTASWHAHTVPLGEAAAADTAGSASEGPRIDLTMTGVVLGSPAYMAPEQWLDPAAAGAAADQYALGVLLHETLTGQLPFVGSSFEEMQYLHCEVDPPPLGAAVPPPVERVVRRAMAKRPDERFASVLELAAALRLAAKPAAAVAIPAADEAPAATGNPYRGLSAFEAEHRALYFGRDREVREVVARLRRDPLVIVAGDSGVGKSSLCRAGVAPAVERGALGDGRRWQAVTIQPGRRPASALTAALDGFAGDGPADLDALIARVGRAVRSGGGAAPAGLLLLVDQLEELVTLSEPDEAATFAEMLLRLCALPGGARVLAAVRGDFATRVLARLGPSEEIVRTLHVLAPLEPEGIRAAVIGPAQAMGHHFESDEMVDALVGQAAGTDGALPLLQFALAELWELRDPERRLIPAAALEQVGGLTGIVSRHADHLLQALRPVQRAAARRILLRLVTGERTRARRRADDLLPAAATGDDRAALEALIRGRVVVARDDEEGAAYELAHEVLIASWGTLAGWLTADADRHAAEERLRAAAGEWERMGRAREALYRDAQLREASLVDEADLDGGPAEFLRASRRALRRRRLAWRAGLAAAFLLLAAFAAALVMLNREADDKNREARRHIVALYTEQGRRALLDGHRQRALVYLAEAWRRGGRDPALRFLLSRAGTALDQEVALLVGHQNIVREARVAPGGRLVATVSDDNTARLWDASSGRLVRTLVGHRSWVRAASFSPRGDALLTVSWDGTARLWDVASGRALWVVDLRGGRPADPSIHGVTRYMGVPCAGDFSPDGSRVVAACVDSRAAVIAADSGAVISWIDTDGLVIAACFAPDGRAVLVIGLAGSALHDPDDGRAIATLAAPEGSIRGGSFSADGSRVLTIGRAGVSRVWSREDGRPGAVLAGHEGVVAAGWISRDGSRAVTAGADGTVRVFDAADGHALSVARHHEAPIKSMDVSADGARIVTGDESGIGVLSQPDGRRLAVLEGHQYMIFSSRFSPDGTRAVTAGGDGTARVWRVSGDRVDRLAGHRGTVTGVRFAAGGEVLLSASEDATVRMWRSDRGTWRSSVFARADQPLWALAVDPADRLVAAGGVDGAIRIWQLDGGRLLHTLRGPPGAVHALAFDRAGTALASVGADGAARVWQLGRDQPAAVIPHAHGAEKVNAVAFDPAGRYLATGGDDRAVRLWSRSTWRPITALEHGASIGQLSVCGDRLLAGAGSLIRSWRPDLSPDAVMSASGEALIAPSCSDGQVAAGGGSEIRIADVASGTALERIELFGIEMTTVDAAGSATIAVGSVAGDVVVTRLELDRRPPGEVSRLARRLPLALGTDGIIRLTPR